MKAKSISKIELQFNAIKFLNLKCGQILCVHT